MELEHSFTVPVPEERAWDVLLDVERVAPCMPGATLDSVAGDEINGRIKVKVGPISMTYAGTARFTERDPAAHVITLEAAGKETRGAGTASARVRSMLEGAGDKTHVIVHTSLNVTGRPAQFGRGVMAEVGGKLIGIFAENLAAMLAAEPAAAAVTAAAENSDGNVAGLSTGAADEALPIDVLNLQPRVWNSLRKEGIQTLSDLTRLTEQQLMAIDGVGPASVAAIRSKLADRGLALADSAEETGTAGPPGQASRHGKAAAEPSDRPVTDLNGDRPAAGKHAAAGEDLAEVTPLRPSRHDTARPDEVGQGRPAEREPARPAATARDAAETEPSAWQPPDNDAIDLLDVAGLPVLKRAWPAAAGLIAVVVIVLRVRRRRSRRG
jgi:carbon monoxide dehydrogenase subunit G